jgi:hypothetical protein
MRTAHLTTTGLTVALLWLGLSGVAIAQSLTDTLTNPQWEAVPDTYSPALGDSAYMDMHGIVRTGDEVVFDVVNPDVSYGRLQGNCSTGELRGIRFGEFQSATQVVFDEISESLTSPYQQTLLSYACSAQP